MKKYKVNVNGTLYEISLEVIDGDAEQTTAPARIAEEAKTNSPAGAEQIKSPMPGTILAVNVIEGSKIKKGQVIMVLEAMKMENEILSPRDGKIVSINVSKGSSVESGALLCVIE